MIWGTEVAVQAVSYFSNVPAANQGQENRLALWMIDIAPNESMREGIGWTDPW